MKKNAAFFCSSCGNEFPKWMGRCPACGEWNTLAEQPSGEPERTGRGLGARPAAAPVRLSEIDLSGEARFSTGLAEFDRVLGGGAVRGSICLVSGEPGIGKSTLMMQVCRNICKTSRVLYVSGEESPRQLRLRGERIGVADMLVFCQTDIDEVLASVAASNPDVLVLDSIQTMYRASLPSAPGSASQVRECAMALMRLAKDEGVTVFVVGHVTKEGLAAGPKLLEHMVDCVLYFEGDRNLAYRVLRADKNRFGSTQEIGVFEMGGEGLVEVPNPSEALLAGRPAHVPGTCVACVMEGTRPVLAEVQALVSPTAFGNPRRAVSGLDYNRAMLLLSVLEKRGGLYLGNQDAYLNVVGGLRVEERASDLPALLAVASSHRDEPLPADLAAFGEVGLTGELRAVPFAAQRIAEIYRLGFLRCVIPAQGTKKLLVPEGMTVYRAKTFKEACAAVF